MLRRSAGFLASDDASNLAGQTIHADGGRLAGHQTVQARCSLPAIATSTRTSYVSALRAHRGDESEQRAARPGSRRARHRRFNQSGDRPPTSVRRLLRYLIHVVGWAHRQELGLRELA
jgi:hypothetical protein